MDIVGLSSPFGNQTRTRVLVEIHRRGESWGRALSTDLGLFVNSVQQAVESLELDSLIVGRLVGKTRLLTLNPAYYAIAELRAYLDKLSDGMKQQGL